MTFSPELPMSRIFQAYKRKTEAAKKEYLKALAAYRASLVSKVTQSPGKAPMRVSHWRDRVKAGTTRNNGYHRPQRRPVVPVGQTPWERLQCGRLYV